MLRGSPGGLGPTRVLMDSENQGALRVQPEGPGLDLQTVEAHKKLCTGDTYPVSEEPWPKPSAGGRGKVQLEPVRLPQRDWRGWRRGGAEPRR